MDTSKRVSDWTISALSDIGGGVLIAGYMAHLRFTSRSAGGSVDGIYMGAGVGISASVNLSFIKQLADKVAGEANVAPQIGMQMTGNTLTPFCAEQIAIIHCTIFNAGVAAGVAPADIKWLRFGNLFQAQQAVATVKVGAGVGADWTAGRFVAFSPRMAGSINYLDRMEVEQAMKGDGIIRSRQGGGW